MASFIVYDSINMYRSDNDINEGTLSGSSPTQTFAESNVIDSHERSADQSIGTTLTAINSGDTIQYALGSSATANCGAVYFTGASGGSGSIIRFLKGDSGSITNLETITPATEAGWKVADLTSSTSSKFYAKFFNTPISNVAEILIGKKLNFEVEPDANVQESFESQNIITRSLGGTEYALNTSDPQKIFTISFGNISQTFKNDLITFMENSKIEAKKFLYFDGSAYHWCRLSGPISFSEVADSRYSCSITMRQQIQ